MSLDGFWRAGESPRRSPRWRRHLQMIAWNARRALPPGVKRFMDVAGAGVAILALSPLLVATWLAIRLQDGGPALFRQVRVGLDGRTFEMLKFRSMVLDAERLKRSLEARNESAGGVLFKMLDDPRITPVGRVIRKYSIDELPQLVNVLRGDMSLVGPRPALPQEVFKYPPAARARLRVKPGITCLWQVGGRSRIGFEGQVQLDVQYIRTWSLASDLRILLRTVPAVLAADGAC